LAKGIKHSTAQANECRQSNVKIRTEDDHDEHDNCQAKEAVEQVVERGQVMLRLGAPHASDDALELIVPVREENGEPNNDDDSDDWGEPIEAQ
jgi:hypothetical protein